MFASLRRGNTAAALRVFKARFGKYMASELRLASSSIASYLERRVSVRPASVFTSEMTIMLSRGEGSACSTRERV